MNRFKEKRNSLELFVKEQIIGPGAYNKRYFFLENWDKSNHEFSGKLLLNEFAIDNYSEVIPEVPAYQYSSAIIFPETSVKSVEKKNEIDKENVEDELSIEESSKNTSADDEVFIEESDESLVSKQQNYPNQIGLSFVVDAKTDLQNELDVSLSFRKYKLISQTACFDRKIAVWVPEYSEEIKEAVRLYFEQLFITKEIDGNTFVCLNKKITKEIIYQIDYIYLNNYLRNDLIFEINNIFKDELIILKETNNIIYWGLKGTREYQFYSDGVNKYTNNKNVITLFDSSLNNYIQTRLKESIENYSIYKNLIRKIEIYNQLKNIVTDLKSIFKERNSTPIWQSSLYNLKLLLPEYDHSKSIDRKELLSVNPNDSELKDLKYKVQYIKKGNLIYIKILLINYNRICLEPNEPPQLNKKNEANIKSFFGVKLKVLETKCDILQQYNPPQLLDIDEEDNLNKLLYRNYLDYGEGYNTSVDWGHENNKTYIATEFLPGQETPKVDFKPSKIENGRIISRLKKTDVLSMRFLSTLSTTTNESIIESLNSFIDEYKLWIEEKKVDLNKIHKAEDRKILEKQINSCDLDFRRLKRNIKLLENDSKALAAFRLMNTSMFMQLHHSILKKKESIINYNLNEAYYRNINLESDYKWRSFQLAFILLNIDGFVCPPNNSEVEDVFGTGWTERNEIADLVWFPTGGGKTEAYFGIISFAIVYRRFTKDIRGFGTTVIMRYTLRLLTLEQFQRATLLICALEVIRKDKYSIPNNYNLGNERITIGLFVGTSSLPNKWKGNDNQDSMLSEFKNIAESIGNNEKIKTSLPFTDCPWCGNELFIDNKLVNVHPNHINPKYNIDDGLSICCNNTNCSFYNKFPVPKKSLPLRLFDEDIYKFPPTLLFGTVDKFAAFANKISTDSSKINEDSQRLIGKGCLPKGKKRECLPPELIIQDELHLLSGPLGTAVGLFEKGIDYLCSYKENGKLIRPKIITSTATTRNTDKQIFALFNRRSEIFPKQGITCDDSFFAYYERIEDGVYISNRKYIGVLPVGKTQVWMQLRIAAISLAHRIKYLNQKFSLERIFENSDFNDYINQTSDGKNEFDYYHTVLSYFNSLKDVGKTQSQLSHYLPGDLNYIIKNTIPWSFLDKIIRNEEEIKYSELTGRLSGEQVKTNKTEIGNRWNLYLNEDSKTKLNVIPPPEYVISTNMISVGIDISRFNTMIISSMPRNVAEYIQASSRVARDKEGIVFTVHHPFRSRDISHYQKFKEFHEKFYSYVEPISVTPFASKALDRYLAMLVILLVRHNDSLGLKNNDDASNNVTNKIPKIKKIVKDEIELIYLNATKLDYYLKNRVAGIQSSVEGIISKEEVVDIDFKLNELLENWLIRLSESSSTNPPQNLQYRNEKNPKQSLYVSVADDNHPNHWKVSHSLREIAPSTVIKTVQQ